MIVANRRLTWGAKKAPGKAGSQGGKGLHPFPGAIYGQLRWASGRATFEGKMVRAVGKNVPPCNCSRNSVLGRSRTCVVVAALHSAPIVDLLNLLYRSVRQLPCDRERFAGPQD